MSVDTHRACALATDGGVVCWDTTGTVLGWGTFRTALLSLTTREPC